MFHMLLLELEITKKEWFEKISKFNSGNNNGKKYKVEAIWNSAVYANRVKSGHLLGFYYLVV